MEVAHIKKIIYLFFTHSHDKFLPPPLLTPLEKNHGAAIGRNASRSVKRVLSISRTQHISNF